MSAGRIVFGAGRRRELGRLVESWGRRALLVTGKNPERAASIEEQLTSANIHFTTLRVSREPDIGDARRAAELGRDFGAEFVVACGGGSALDLGKAAAALVQAPSDVLEYLEVIGGGRTLSSPVLPCVAIPTTSGTGSEVTKNAVLSSPEHRVKVSLRHDDMVPRLALVDPELTHSLSPRVTAETGLDALTQCLEPIVSRQATPLTDALAFEGLTRGGRSLLQAVRHGEDAAAREDLSLCSLLGGLALANAKLGAVHGFAGPIGGRFESPHGAVCAKLLPLVVEVNVRALREREPNSPVLPRYTRVAQVLTGDAEATIEEGIAWLDSLTKELGIVPLSSYGMTQEDLPELVRQSARASSMKGNPIELTQPELTEILERAL